MSFAEFASTGLGRWDGSRSRIKKGIQDACLHHIGLFSDSFE
jgi:hypothetical protein